MQVNRPTMSLTVSADRKTVVKSGVVGGTSKRLRTAINCDRDDHAHSDSLSRVNGRCSMTEEGGVSELTTPIARLLPRRPYQYSYSFCASKGRILARQSLLKSF